MMIAYTADQDTNGRFELYTTNPPPGITVTPVSGNPFAGDTVEDDFKWSPDSSLIAYRADQDTPNKIELYATDPAGTENNRVSGTLPSGGDVVEFKWNGMTLDLQSDIWQTRSLLRLPNCLPPCRMAAENTRLSSDLVDGSGDPVADGDVSAFEWVP